MDPVIPVGQQAPKFRLADLEGNWLTLEGLMGWIVVLNFW